MCNITQCGGCRHYIDETDTSVGLYADPYCDAVPGSAETEEGTRLLEFFTGIVFTLARLNNCPFYKNKRDYNNRRRIADTIYGQPGIAKPT